MGFTLSWIKLPDSKTKGTFHDTELIADLNSSSGQFGSKYCKSEKWEVSVILYLLASIQVANQ